MEEQLPRLSENFLKASDFNIWTSIEDEEIHLDEALVPSLLLFRFLGECKWNGSVICGSERTIVFVLYDLKGLISPRTAGAQVRHRLYCLSYYTKQLHQESIIVIDEYQLAYTHELLSISSFISSEVPSQMLLHNT